MRSAVLLIAALAAAGGFFWLRQGGASSLGTSRAIAAPMGPSSDASGAPTAAPTKSDGDALATTPEVDALQERMATPVITDTAAREDAGDFSGFMLVPFHGIAMLQLKGQSPYPAVSGTVDVAVLNRGTYVPIQASVSEGKFSLLVPEQCRLRVDGGKLEGQVVRFLGFKGAFSLDADLDYALVGEPVPLNRLRVSEGIQRVPLTSVTVRRADDASVSLTASSLPEGEVIVQDVPSPVDLPFLQANHPVWLQVSADGYATAAVLLNPQQSSTKDVVLWPATSLKVRVTGRGRGRLKTLVVHRMEPSADGAKSTKRHIATLRLDTPGITKDQDAIIFDLTGLPALPLRLEARGFDKRGRETLIGETSIELGPDQAATVNLRVERP